MPAGNSVLAPGPAPGAGLGRNKGPGTAGFNDDIVGMRMGGQLRSPAVQHGREARSRAPEIGLGRPRLVIMWFFGARF